MNGDNYSISNTIPERLYVLAAGDQLDHGGHAAHELQLHLVLRVIVPIELLEQLVQPSQVSAFYQQLCAPAHGLGDNFEDAFHHLEPVAPLAAGSPLVRHLPDI